MPVVVNEIVQTDFEVEIQARIDAERARLRAQAGLARMREFKKPVERTFTGPERDYVTILFGGLTWKHEEMIKAVFHGSGYRCMNIPTPVVADFQAGKEFGNNGQCNPTYFTVGNLVRYLQKLEQEGQTRQQIIDNYVTSPQAPAVRADSACMKQSTGLRCRILALKGSGYCSSSRRMASRLRAASRD
jgi:hypothetical protein